MNIDKLLDYIGWTFLIATLILLKVAERLLDNIILAKSFLLEYSTYGLLISVTFLFIVYKTNPSYLRSGEEKRGSAVLSYFFGVIALFVFVASYYNLETAKAHKNSLKAVVLDKYKNVLHRTTYLQLEINGRKERFQPTLKEWELIEINDTIEIRVGLGELGYEYVFQFTEE